MGWMKLSYSTPSTMYIVTTAARTSSSSFDSEASSAEAAPWKAVTKLSRQADVLLRLPDGGDGCAQ